MSEATESVAAGDGSALVEATEFLLTDEHQATLENEVNEAIANANANGDMKFKVLPSTFEFDRLVAHVQHVNPRMEKHGDTKELAVDVKVRLMMGDVGDEWDDIIAKLMDTIEEPVDLVRDDLSSILKSLPFSHEWEQHRVTFRSSWAENFPDICTLSEAKLNKFDMDIEDLGVTFRIQALADAELVGVLCGLWGTKVGIRIEAEQIPLFPAAQATTGGEPVQEGAQERAGDAHLQQTIDDIVRNGDVNALDPDASDDGRDPHAESPE